jgi:hypothetical protein
MPPKRVRRDIFVLTPEEKRTVCFVLVAFVLGLATKCYRDAHPSVMPGAVKQIRKHSSAAQKR